MLFTVPREGALLLHQMSWRESGVPDLEARPSPMMTPDGRYIVVRGRLWRAANPLLDPAVRQRLVNNLMEARLSVRAALPSSNAEDLLFARTKVQACKEALGERSEAWWSDGEPEFNRRLVEKTPYVEWWSAHSSPFPST